MPFAWKLRVLTTRPPGCRTRSRSPSSSPRPPKTTTRPPRRASLRGCATAGTPSRCRRRLCYVQSPLEQLKWEQQIKEQKDSGGYTCNFSENCSLHHSYSNEYTTK
ncbi:uncharacterized protein ACBT57_026953 isoform 2-T7 [Dama dama]